MITVLGATGFIGSHLVAHLKAQGHTPYTPDRHSDLTGQSLGQVYYCIGLTADFRQHPLDTMQAHVGLLTHILQHCKIESLLYLSSTRVYENAKNGCETTEIPVRSDILSDIYTLSKLSGESICLAQSNSNIKVVRLSNVYGPDWQSANFLMSVIASAIQDGHITLHTAPQTAKDYIHVNTVVRMLPQIAQTGHHRLYNLASGHQISNQILLDRLCTLCQASWKQTENAQHRSFPPINIHRLHTDFSYTSDRLLEDLPDLISRAPYS